MSAWTPTTKQVRDGYRYDPEYDYYNPLQAGANAERAGRDFDRWLEQVKAEARADALADAGLPARPLPTRDEIKKVLQREFGSFLAHDPANPARFWGQSADAVLALLKGQES